MEELNIEDRRKKIMEILNNEDKVKVVELSRLFGISEVTIRNDLAELEEAGMLERVHGGAVITHKAFYNMTFKDHMKTNENEKKRIAVETASMISDGDTIILSSGTTPLFVVRELKNAKNLTIVTNSILIAQEVGHMKNVYVILLGGNFNPQYQFTYGDDTINQLKKYKADKLILSVDGFSAEDGVTTHSHLDAEVNRQMIQRVNKTIVAADYSKVGRASFANIGDIDTIDYLITNTCANKSEIEAIRDKGVEVRLV